MNSGDPSVYYPLLITSWFNSSTCLLLFLVETLRGPRRCPSNFFICSTTNHENFAVRYNTRQIFSIPECLVFFTSFHAVLHLFMKSAINCLQTFIRCFVLWLLLSRSAHCVFDTVTLTRHVKCCIDRPFGRVPRVCQPIFLIIAWKPIASRRMRKKRNTQKKEQ